MIVFIVLLLVVTMGVLWYLGTEKKERDSALTASEENELLQRNSRLEQVVSEALAKNKDLKTFRYSDLPRRASTSDLIISKSNATSTIREYGLQIASILKPYEEERENESKIMIRYLEKGEAKDLESLKKVFLLYRNTDQALLKVSVPKEAAFLHTKLINRIRVMSALLKNMTLVKEEPLLALQSAEVYQKELALFYNTTEELSNYFKARQIIFKPEEKINIYVNLES